MSVIICPGIHEPELTESFLEGLGWSASDKLTNGSKSENILIFPAQDYPAYSAFHILQFLADCGVNPLDRDKSPAQLVFISFSAGVVGAIGAAWAWQALRGNVKAFIAIDGWGVPLGGNFPIHRLSHDRFTHWSSALSLSGEDNFYAEPPVAHLELWRSPQTTQGWWVNSKCGKSEQRRLLTAAQFLTMLLELEEAEGEF
ncbi:hypothetical protein LAY57_09105 [Argonema antarcticum A004/B2]|nr:hypothetical protein [Argonema antarcticum]MCL1470830.1 hypothetical protein [Argonema antarcticum A004/B2]